MCIRQHTLSIHAQGLTGSSDRKGTLGAWSLEGSEGCVREEAWM